MASTITASPAHTARRRQRADRVAQVQQQAADVDEVELTVHLRVEVVDAQLAPVDPRAKRLAGDREPGAAPLRSASAAITSAVAFAGQSHCAGSRMSIADTSAAPRRSISKAQKPSKVPTSRQRWPARTAGSDSAATPRGSNQPGRDHARRELERVVPLARGDPSSPAPR